jgi:asparagine synthase (glutamine-hydrolysing)
MCGITGLAARGGATPVLRALSCIRHRGPDAQGEYHDGPVWLGHQRLSIIDLTDSGAQPMATEDGRFVTCYNGEVYNFRELATELALDGLRSHSDTEVVLRAFQKLGPRSLRLLNGMFAFALYDRVARKLWLVRDRLGIKPLYYRLDEQGLAFGSEIKSIVAADRQPSVCDLSAVHEWLHYGTTLGGRTLYRGIRQLLPGHVLELNLDSFDIDIRPYWSLREQADPKNLVRDSTDEMIAETRRLLDEAVRRQLVSDVPVGVFLSGGVDSTAITAFASRHYAGRLATYSAGFDGAAREDERPKARRVAAHYGTDHHEMTISAGNVADLVELMVRHHDAPFSDAANIPLYLMAAQISGQTKVVLQGDGGDEVFGGYRRYATLKHYPWLHTLATLVRPLPRMMPKSHLRQRVERYVDAFAAPDLATTMALLLTIEDARSRPARVFTAPYQRIIEQSDPFARYREVQSLFAGHDIGSQMSLIDLMIELPDTFLEKVDRATMAASLEVRVPFLDHDLVDYVVRIPGDRKMPGGRKKWLLKQALDGIVPRDVLYGPKSGFNVPFGYWLRTALKPVFFDHLATFERTRPGVLQRQVIEEWYSQSLSGEEDRTYMLWKLLNFLVWCNHSSIVIEA